MHGPMLGIETSGREGTIALLYHDGRCVERALDQAGRRHAQSLVLEIDRLLKEAQLTCFQLGGIGVSVGPGSFTGLRVGVTCAKTLAYAAGVPLAGVDTFVSLARQMPTSGSVLHVIDDAQRGDLFVGTFARKGDDVEEHGPRRIVPTAEFLATVGSDELLVGPAVPLLQQRGLLAEGLRIGEVHRPAAAMIAGLARARLEKGERDDPMRLVPFYLRFSAAEEKWMARGA